MGPAALTPERRASCRAEAGEQARRLHQALDREPPDLEAAHAAVFVLATAAALLQAGWLLRLGRAMRAALHTIPHGSAVLSDVVTEFFPRIAAELERALARPGADDGTPSLLELTEKLEARLGVPSASASMGAEGTGASPDEAALPLPEPSGSAPAVPSGPEIFTSLVDEDMVEPFLEEATERLESLAQKLLRLERRPADQELLKDIFRDLHTIKGSSGFVGLRRMNQLAHAAEDLVGQLRHGSRPADRATIDALLLSIDVLRTILEQATRRVPIDVDLVPCLRQLRNPSLEQAPAGEVAEGGTRAGEHPPDRLARQTLRVDFEKLDLMLNLVGELILGKSRLHGSTAQLSGLSREMGRSLRPGRRLDARALREALDRTQRELEQGAQQLGECAAQIDHITAELRDQVMKLRMVSIGRVFTKHHRTLRELGHALGKQVRLELSGTDTELDKVLVEQLDDPLLHLVRNAIDHGIETPAERQALGKAPEGVLRLHAEHQGNQIVIEIADDGRGIDPEAVRRKAVKSGLLSEQEAAALDRARVLNLILRPGFSTAERVSEVSGRGVGMDVVYQMVNRAKGTIEIDAEPGRGTRFLIRLPLTLAIIQVLLIEVAGETFALPLAAVSRAVHFAHSAVHRLYDRDVMLLELINEAEADRPQQAEVQLLDLGQLLELRAAAPPVFEAQVVLCEVAKTPYGLLCDRLLGKREIVIKTLGELLDQVPGVAGATLIDDRVVLILDLNQLVQRSGQRPRGRSRTPVPAPEERGVAGPRILLAEDSYAEREALCRLLRSHGYSVVAVPDGAAALSIAERDERGFDLVSTDVTMPHLDGYELTRRLRAQERHRHVPILMLTARSEPVDRVRGFDVGVDEYLLKPVDPARLLRAIAHHLRHSHPAEPAAPASTGRTPS